MPKYKFTGEDGRVFPTLGKTLKKGDTFESTVRIVAPFLEEIEDDAKVTVKFDAPEATKEKKSKKADEVVVVETEATSDSTESE